MWDFQTKPKITRSGAAFLEVPAAGFFIHAAGTLEVTRPYSIRFVQPLIATNLYTGMRESEPYETNLEDFNFDRELVYERERDATGRLKTAAPRRLMRFPPMLLRILRPYFAASGQGPHQLAFLSPDGRDTNLSDTRKVLQRVAARAHELAPTPELRATFADPMKSRPKRICHPFCSVRSQTLDGGKPIATATVGPREPRHDFEGVQRHWHRQAPPTLGQWRRNRRIELVDQECHARRLGRVC